MSFVKEQIQNSLNNGSREQVLAAMVQGTELKEKGTLTRVHHTRELAPVSGTGVVQEHPESGQGSRNQTPGLGSNVSPKHLAAGLISGLEDSLFRCSWRSEGSSCSLSVSTDAERDADACAVVLPPTHLSFQVSNLMI